MIARHVAGDTDMRIAGMQDLTSSYVRTLREWRANFEANGARLRALGYDERFQRLWRLYLAYCEAGFAERRIGDFQLLLGKPGYAGASSLRASSTDSRAMSAIVP